MPVVSVPRDKLFVALGKTYSDHDFGILCFDYGLELDDVTSEREMLRKEFAAEEAASSEAAAATAAVGGGASGGTTTTTTTTTNAAQAADATQAARLAAASDEVVYKIDIPANRYDLLCLEGIARALNIFNGTLAGVTYTLADVLAASRVRIVTRPEVVLIRPFIVGAVLRGLTLDAPRVASLMDLQDRLHTNLCRQRSLVAIGTHDLGKLAPPFVYEARPPTDIEFVPLKQDRAWRADQLLEHYAANDVKLKRFVPLIQTSPVYPVVRDSAGTVASLPPVINGAVSAVSPSTRDLFIECTGTDLRKCRTVLATVVAMFSEYAATPFQAEPVDVVDALGVTHSYPDVSPRVMEVDTAYINGLIGTDLDAKAVATKLSRMGLSARPAAEALAPASITPSSAAFFDRLRPEGPPSSSAIRLAVSIPPTRSDVLHACDVAEDVAIAHGYNNIEAGLPTLAGPAAAGGRGAPLAELCEALRVEMAGAGYTEVLTWALGPAADCGPRLRRPAPAAAHLTGAATAEFEIVRTSLLPGLLRTLASARDTPSPFRLFEVGDVVLLDAGVGAGLAGGRWGDAPEPASGGEEEEKKGEVGAGAAPPAPPTPASSSPPQPPAGATAPSNGTGATNARRLVALYAASAGAFTVIHGLLNRVMQAAGVPLPPTLAPDLGPGAAEAAAAQAKSLGGATYGWTPSSDPAFLPGRQAAITFPAASSTRIGVFGLLHPDTVAAFGITTHLAVGALELDLEPLCFDQAGQRLRTHLDMGAAV